MANFATEVDDHSELVLPTGADAFSICIAFWVVRSSDVLHTSEDSCHDPALTFTGTVA